MAAVKELEATCVYAFGLLCLEREWNALRRIAGLAKGKTVLKRKTCT